jgi:hypothetical protein
MMKTKLMALAAASVLSLGAVERASAAPIVLTFEGLGNEQAIGDYYNGGAGGNYGISFGSDSLALIESSAGGTGNFSNPPSGTTVAFFLGGPGDVMDVAAGFDTGFSFYYADQVGFTGSVSVYDGLDGTGNLLTSLSLPSTPDPYTVFVPIGVNFSGTAKSVVFGGSANYIAFDNVTLGSSTAGGVPEPATWAMMLMGFGGLGAALRSTRRKQAALAA